MDMCAKGVEIQVCLEDYAIGAVGNMVEDLINLLGSAKKGVGKKSCPSDHFLRHRMRVLISIQKLLQ